MTENFYRRKSLHFIWLITTSHFLTLFELVCLNISHIMLTAFDHLHSNVFIFTKRPYLRYTLSFLDLCW